MARVRLYFMQIWDKEGNLLEIKATSAKEVSSFVRRNGGSIGRFYQGSRMVPESKLQHCIDNVSIEDLMTLKKDENEK